MHIVERKSAQPHVKKAHTGFEPRCKRTFSSCKVAPRQAPYERGPLELLVVCRHQHVGVVELSLVSDDVGVGPSGGDEVVVPDLLPDSRPSRSSSAASLWPPHARSTRAGEGPMVPTINSFAVSGTS